MTLVILSGEQYMSIKTDLMLTHFTLGVTTMDVIGSFRKWRNYRRTVSELSSLSNRELDDLGINRGDINFVARNIR